MGDRSNYAIKVDEHKISYNDFNQQKRLVQESNRRMLGELYDQYEQTINARLDQEIIESMISDVLLDKFARAHELFPAKDAARKRLLQLFQGQFDAGAYRNFLSQIQKTALDFESDLERESLKEQLSALLQDVSLASMSESRALYGLDQTSYDVAYLPFKTGDFVAKVPDPADEELQKIYEERAAELEAPAQASYEYVVFSPDDFLSAVEVSPDDVEFYYSEHQNLYTLPEQGHFRHIRFTYPEKASPEEMAKVKEKADESLLRVKGGEPFDALARQYSDDFASSVNGGDLGWLAKGQMSKEFDQAAFKLNPGQNSDLVATDSGFHIIRMEEFKDKALKPLDEVRAEIESQIRKQEAPGYMGVKAQELYDSWLKSAKNLPEFGAEHSLKVEKTNGMLASGSDPLLELGGLSDKVLQIADQKQQLVELKEKYALVQVSEFKPAETPPFPALRSRLIEDYKKIEAAKLAQQAAYDFAKAFKDDSAISLGEYSKSKGLSIQTASAVKRGSRNSGFVASSEAQQLIFTTSEANQKSLEPLSFNGDYYLLQVTALNQPAPDSFDAKRQEYFARASQSIERALMASLVNGLKAKAELDVAPDLLSNQS